MPKYDIQLIIALRFRTASALAGVVKKKRTQTHHHHTERKEKKRKEEGKTGRDSSTTYIVSLVIVKKPRAPPPPHPTLALLFRVTYIKGPGVGICTLHDVTRDLLSSPTSNYERFS